MPLCGVGGLCLRDLDDLFVSGLCLEQLRFLLVGVGYRLSLKACDTAEAVIDPRVVAVLCGKLVQIGDGLLIVFGVDHLLDLEQAAGDRIFDNGGYSRVFLTFLASG